ncbi:MAG: nucleotidyltransferase domain-containing protein [Saprospiraceae bacterium]|nr:nucleotidyltransferase domain-containing protein [Saprospiraceae bacterium]
MVDQQTAIATVKKFAEDIKLQGINLRKVILFGSYAKGNQHEWSDIDVALVADEFVGVGFQDILLFLDITIKKPYLHIEPHTFNTREFKTDNPLISEICRTGIAIS